MATELIINASLPETRIALMESGEIQDLLIERASGKGIVGNIYKGRVTRVLPGMQAAFVDIGLEKAAFLYVDDVFVHSEIWEEEEGAPSPREAALSEVQTGGAPAGESAVEPLGEVKTESTEAETAAETRAPSEVSEGAESAEVDDEFSDDIADDLADDLVDDEDEDEDDDEGPQEMGDDPEGGGGDEPRDTVAPPSAEGAAGPGAGKDGGKEGQRHRRGRRGGRFRKRRPPKEGGPVAAGAAAPQDPNASYPENFNEQLSDSGEIESDRSAMSGEVAAQEVEGNRPTSAAPRAEAEGQGPASTNARAEFRSQRGRDRRIRSRSSMRPPRPQVNIQDLLKEGQEVLVQVAKDPIATKGARLTCHISLPGRHLVCMPTIDHVGVSRRIERDDERRRLREYVERSRPKGLGFIVRTASGKQSEQRVKQDVEYLARLWGEIKEKASTTTAPALVYEDLNSVLRAIRDWVTEEIDKIVVDSRYYYNDIQRFVAHFMPSLKHKIELYHGDIPIFDAYSISTELARALERKVWLKSGGYLVVDQAEALVAIDVNTGRYVGKKNLEDTILKTNLEAVQEIAYQLRLRNCGGIIILDLIDMEREENKQRVYRALEEALRGDRARPSILKISELGLVEMTRKRTRDTMVRALCESCSHCEGKGFVKSKTTVAYEVLREIERTGIERDVNKVLIQAHPDVIDILAIEERETLDQLERRYHRQVYLQAVGDMHVEQFEVISDKKERAEQGAQPRNDRDNRDRDANQNRNRGGGGRNRSGSSGGRDRDRPSRNPVPLSASMQHPPLPTALPIGNATVSETDPEAVGNRAPGLPVPNGTRVTGEAPAAPDEFFDEEDRLAFLRAQAAQDAALAQLRSAGAGAPAVGRPGVGGGGAPRGDRGPRNNTNPNNNNNRRGKRGGRFRRNERPRHFGPRDAQAGGPPPPIPTGVDRGEPSSGGGGGGGGSGSQEGSSGGGGGGGIPGADG